VTRQIVNENHTPPIGFDTRSLGQVFVRVVSPFDVDFWLKLTNELLGSWIIKDDDCIDWTQSSQQAGTLKRWNNGATCSFELLSAAISVDTQNQGVAECPRFFQIIQMPDVQQIKVPVREHQPFAVLPQFIPCFYRRFKR